jgi:oligosaccharide reducing-end xylanase
MIKPINFVLNLVVILALVLIWQPMPSATAMTTLNDIARLGESPVTSRSLYLPLVTKASNGAFQSGQYRDLFKEYLGKTDSEIQAKLDATWNQLFYGDDISQRIYYPVGSNMAYIKDVGNSDVRTEGMSYGMMIAVQLNKKAEFDRLWMWTRTYMYQSGSSPYAGYFAWHCRTDGSQFQGDIGPAPDGEEWLSMALLFASSRWGDGSGADPYRLEAQHILTTMLHKADENNGVVGNMFDPAQKLVVFVPQPWGSGYTDPSYHLPAYYELWALWAKQDNAFWKSAATASRFFFKTAANPTTGLMADYTYFNGSPYNDTLHKDFRFDAWRTLSNVAVDYSWFQADPWEVEQSNRVLDFLTAKNINSYPDQYSVTGTPLSVNHSTGLVAMAAVAALAADPAKGKPFVQALWDAPIPSGTWRYYDGSLYFLALLHVSGQFRIYSPILVNSLDGK